MTPMLLVLPWLVAAPVPKDFKKETPQLIGKWRMLEITVNGEKVAVQFPPQQNAIWQFEEKQVKISNGGKQESFPIKTDAKSSPKEFQFNLVPNNFTQLGIYEIEGEMLSICMGLTQGQRPTAITGGRNEAVYKFVRVKE